MDTDPEAARAEPRRARRFQLVDVFSPDPFGGNPLGVVVEADGLATEDMRRITRWMNHSETAFLLPPSTPEADYRVRIFTLERELPFAGHPTLGSCHAWVRAGGRPRRPGRVVQECGAGLVPLRQSGDGWAFAAPPLLRSGPVEEALLARVAGVLGIPRAEIVDAQWADNGPGWIAVLLESAQAVLELSPSASPGGRFEIGAVGPHPEGAPCRYEVRAFFTDQHDRMREDPVTGSLNASLAQWLVGCGRARPPYTVAQGTALGVTGRPRIEQDADGALWVGGATATLIEGVVEIAEAAR